MRPALALGGVTDVIVMPSTSKSASAATTSPTLASGYSSEDATTPLGWRAPAARQVQVPSSRALVSSTSILRGIGLPSYRTFGGAPLPLSGCSCIAAAISSSATSV